MWESFQAHIAGEFIVLSWILRLCGVVTVWILQIKVSRVKKSTTCLKIKKNSEVQLVLLIKPLKTIPHFFHHLTKIQQKLKIFI